MQDELSLSHEARIAWMNGSKPLAKLTAIIRAELVEQGYKVDGLPRLHQLALVSNKAPADYIRSHSMIASVRVAAKRGENVPHSEPVSHKYIRPNGMRTQRLGAYCCAKCIQEDREGKSYSWYRRKHHLIGVDWCDIHGDPLYKVESPHPFLHPPHIWLSKGKLEPIGACAPSLPEEGFLYRYTKIACALLDRHQPYCVEKIAPRLAQRAMELNLRIGPRGNRPLISDRLFELAPAEWLKMHLKGSEQKVFMETFRRIDFVARSQNTPGAGDAYAMVAATLYDTADEAMRELSLADEADVYRKPKKINRRGEQFWEGQIWRYYLNSSGVHARIANELGMVHSDLTRRLSALGLPSLYERGADGTRAWRAFERFSLGESIEMACQQECIEGEALEEILRKCSIRVFRAIEKIQKVPNKEKNDDEESNN